MDETGKAEAEARKLPAAPPVSIRRAAFTGGHLETLTEEGQISRDRLLRAAAAAFTQKGFAATSIEDVARRLGATKGLVYHHYRSKNDLFFDVSRHGIGIDMAAVEPHAAARDRAVTRLARMAVAHVAAMLERRDFQLAILEGVSIHLGKRIDEEDRATLASLVAARERYEAIFADTLAAAIAEGDVETTIAPALCAAALLAVLNAPLSRQALCGQEGPEARAAIACDLTIFALRGAGASSAILAEEFG
jgi:AcrR family transcriptional regulator